MNKRIITSYLLLVCLFVFPLLGGAGVGKSQPATNKIIMHAINDFFFLYILCPTAAITYVVAMWSFIIWTIKEWLKARKEKKGDPPGGGTPLLHINSRLPTLA